jgi:hypothetical protein
VQLYIVGDILGRTDGTLDGFPEAVTVGKDDGCIVGRKLGSMEGTKEVDGIELGKDVGCIDILGIVLGLLLGLEDNVGCIDGMNVGRRLGL